MYSNMCVRIALCLALIVIADGYVLKDPTLHLPADGVSLDIPVRNKDDQHPVSTMKINIDEKDKTVEMSMPEAPSGAQKHLATSPDAPATLGDRFGIAVGTCPLGYTSRGGFCFPDDD